MTDKQELVKNTLILGVGNIVMGDEGFGVHVVGTSIVAWKRPLYRS